MLSLLRIRQLTAAANRLDPLRATSQTYTVISRSVSTSAMSSPYETILTKDGPTPIGPYSQAVKHNGVVYVSGCIPVNPATGELVTGDIESQTTRSLENLKAVVQASGSDLSHVLKTTLFLKDMGDFAKINAIYEKFFAPYKPARSAVEVARLPKDVDFEIECVAACSHAMHNALEIANMQVKPQSRERRTKERRKESPEHEKRDGRKR